MDKHRFSIMGRPYGQNREVEIAQCDSNPEAIAEAAREKTISLELGQTKAGKPRKVLVGNYEHVHIVDRDEGLPTAKEMRGIFRDVGPAAGEPDTGCIDPDAPHER